MSSDDKRETFSVDDGFGNMWTCRHDFPSGVCCMEVVRPGKCQCPCDDSAVGNMLAHLKQRAAPSAVAEQKPVAWRWHWKGGDEPDVWGYSEHSMKSDQHRHAEPLYAAPVAPSERGSSLPAGLTDKEFVDLMAVRPMNTWGATDMVRLLNIAVCATQPHLEAEDGPFR